MLRNGSNLGLNQRMVLLGLLFLVLISTFLEAGYGQVNTYLLNCGSTDSIVDANGRRWVADSSGENFTLSDNGTAVSSVTVEDNSIYQSLYKTLRVFNSSAYYSFNVSPGSYCIRLHFYPFSAGSLNINDSVFDVTANELRLVSQFNVPVEILCWNSRMNEVHNSLIKEYFLNVSSNELKIKFVPSVTSFAFVNAIEITEVMNNMFVDAATKVGTKEKLPFSLNEHGIETMYRLNVGGPALEPGKDRDLWRKWDPDDNFMFSANAAIAISNRSNISYSSLNASSIAPLLVYETARIMSDNEVVEKRFNVSWRFLVDPNFEYLIRMHFCELVYDKQNQRIFRIYINNKTAAEEYDVYLQARGMNKAYHEDFSDVLSRQIDTLWLQLGPEPSVGPSGIDAILNGVEIFKLSKNGSLAHVSERISINEEGVSTKKTKSKVLWAATGIGASVVTISIACVFLLHHVRKRKADSVKEDPSSWRPLFVHATMASTTNAAAKSPLINNGLPAPNRTGRRFTLAEIRVATSNFDESLVIGTGGFGKVYKGEIDDGILVAIKRGNPQSQQGAAEFETEIEMLSKLRHRHLVSMIGFCDEQKEMILVYEYMANGTLRSHLYGTSQPALSWKQRLDACIGAARGLHYLHTGAEWCIIHRDVKTTNILLDGDFVAKMADFGLSRAGPSLDHTHVSTAVKGSFGYLDPEYFRRQQLTQKSDVYSFGVVLFEVVCARPVINPSLPKDQSNLAEWALRWQRQRSLESIIDPKLDGDYSLESLRKFGELAEKCLADEGKNRPNMGDVLWHLEYVLHLHEAYRKSREGDSFGSTELGFTDVPFSLPFVREGDEEHVS
ncbi:putative receptor-like protein kinase At1g30570 [Curcuma longa]|uniref:putative receptor-like protein kinase At1g30570 n=1 Tax=Curcuma longa TaxID=136217 RepID=UPI003D9EFC78